MGSTPMPWRKRQTPGVAISVWRIRLFGDTPAAVTALIDAHNRGVGTRVILGAAFHGHKKRRHLPRTQLGHRLARPGLSVVSCTWESLDFARSLFGDSVLLPELRTH